MPNHVHGIIELKTESVGAENFPPINENTANNNDESSNNVDSWINVDLSNNDYWAVNDSPLRHSPSKTIGSIVRGFKIGVTKWMRQKTDIYDVLQRN